MRLMGWFRRKPKLKLFRGDGYFYTDLRFDEEALVEAVSEIIEEGKARELVGSLVRGKVEPFPMPQHVAEKLQEIFGFMGVAVSGTAYREEILQRSQVRFRGEYHFDEDLMLCRVCGYADPFGSTHCGKRMVQLTKLSDKEIMKYDSTEKTGESPTIDDGYKAVNIKWR